MRGTNTVDNPPRYCLRQGEAQPQGIQAENRRVTLVPPRSLQSQPAPGGREKINLYLHAQKQQKQSDQSSRKKPKRRRGQEPVGRQKQNSGPIVVVENKREEQDASGQSGQSQPSHGQEQCQQIYR
jgi:hypothetical protein